MRQPTDAGIGDFLIEYRSFWADGPWGVAVTGKTKRVGAVDVSGQFYRGRPDGTVVPELVWR